MATFPGGVLSWTDVVDLVDDVLATHPNTLAAEVVALEEFLISTTRSPNYVFAGPTSAPDAAADFRALVAADIPNLAASKITSGQLVLERGGTEADLSSTGGSSPDHYLKQAGAGAAITVGAIAVADVPNLPTSILTSGQLTLERGGTEADLSGTGGSGQYLKQSGAGAAITVGTIASADLPTADETTVGALEVATTAETTAFTLDTKIVTPGKLGDAIPATPAADLGLRLDGSGNVVLPAGGGVQLSDESGYVGTSITLSSATYYGRFVGRRSRGTIGSESAAQADDILVHLGGRGYGATGWPSAANAAINLHAEENFTDTDQGTYIAFSTTPTGSTTAAEACRINSSGNLVFTDGNNVQVDRVRARDGDGLELFDDGGTGLFVEDGGQIYLGTTTTCADATLGLVIDQGANDDGIIVMKSSDVAHGMTDDYETDTFGLINKSSPDAGGLRLQGITEGAIGMTLISRITDDSTDKDSSAFGALSVFNSKKSSNSALGDVNSSQNVASFFARLSGVNRTVAIICADGDLYLDTAVNENNWDDYDDLALLHGFRASITPSLQERFGKFMNYARPVLERTGVVTYNDDGHHFVATKKLQMLTIDAVRQLFGGFLEYKQRTDKEILQLRDRINNLEAEE